MTRSDDPVRPPAGVRRPLVLASSSPYRRELLARLDPAFTCADPAIDERPRDGETPSELVRRLAESKARAVAPRCPGALVVGSDQLATDGQRIVGKPGTRAAAVRQLTAAAGRGLQFLTAVAVLDVATARCLVDVVSVDVVFRALDEARIRAYVEREPALDCAGSFKCEGLGIGLVERIVSDDPTALVGLPLITLTRLLAAHGFDVITGRDAGSPVG